MKKFSYEARDQATDQVVKATLQAESESAAAKLLISQGFAPLIIKEQIGDGSVLQRLSGRITVKDKVIFTRQLATLLGAGLPLVQSLHTAVEQTENKQLQSVIHDVTASVEGGKSLSDALKIHPRVFDNVFVSLVSAGELSGTLDTALQRIANQQEKDAAIMSKIRGAMTYPIIVLGVIGGVMAFMLLTVVPQVEKLYKDLHKELPFLTQIMVTIADFMTQFWWIVIIGLLVGAYFLWQYFHTDAGIRTADTFKVKVPMFGTMFQKLYMARFARTGETLLSSGVSMLDMLRIVSTAVNNVVIRDAIVRSTEKVKGGKALSTALEQERSFMRLVPQMIKIGEQSGKVDGMLGKVAQVYEDELDEQIRTISTAIEPILMIVLAVVAGGMVGAVLLPIYGLVNSISAG